MNGYQYQSQLRNDWNQTWTTLAEDMKCTIELE